VLLATFPAAPAHHQTKPYTEKKKNKWCAAKHPPLRTFLCIALPVAITTEVTTAFYKMRWQPTE
jgi:hypothetical protein